MDHDVILVRYGEIGLKGRNRPAFEERLLANVRRAVANQPGARFEKEYGRMLVQLDAASSQQRDDILARVASVFGVVSVSPAHAVRLTMDDLRDVSRRVIARRLEEKAGVVSFKVETRRSNKRFPLTSPEVNAELGAELLRSFDRLKVDVRQPDIQLNVEIRDRFAYVYDRTIKGPGGLPVGSSSRALLLLSGGIDSPVAGWLAMKRGVALEAIHFHSFPFTSDRSKEKVIELAQILSRYAEGPIRLHVVSFTKTQTAIRQRVPPSMGITVMRRMMLRIAERIARERSIPALVTGESIGQVASQTLESMAAINAVTCMPILRPLAAMDKTEIVDMAQAIGTYDTSILPYEDCCTLFVPENPETKPNVARIERAEQALDAAALVDEAIHDVEVVEAH